MEAQLYPNKVLGFRAWACSWDGQLQALVPAHRAAWVQGVNVAGCKHRCSGPVPAPACECGLYAHHSLIAARELLYTYRSRDALGGSGVAGFVLGTVAGSGRAQLHWSGWRAERAEIVALRHTSRLAPELLGELAARYCVPVVATNAELRELGLEAASVVPLAERPLPFDEQECEWFRKQIPLAATDQLRLQVLARELGVMVSEFEGLPERLGLDLQLAGVSAPDPTGPAPRR